MVLVYGVDKVWRRRGKAGKHPQISQITQILTKRRKAKKVHMDGQDKQDKNLGLFTGFHMWLLGRCLFWSDGWCFAASGMGGVVVFILVGWFVRVIFLGRGL